MALLPLVVLALGGSGALAAPLNAPASKPCNGRFSSAFPFHVIAGSSYEVRVAGTYGRTSSGSGRGGGYRTRHAALHYSRISEVTVRDAAGRIVATPERVQKRGTYGPVDRFAGSFVSQTDEIAVSIAGTCWTAPPRRDKASEASPGRATFTLVVDGPAPPRPARPRPQED
jgi:hypothetical protein